MQLETGRMQLRIQIAEEVDRQKWDDYVLDHPDGLAYHQFAWKLAVEEAYNFTGYYLMAVAGKEIQGVFPLVVFSVPLRGSTLVSLPYCDVGGILADNIEAESILKQAALDYLKKFDMKGLHLRRSGTRCLDGVDQDLWSTKVRMVLPLPDSSEALLANFKSKLRSQIKKPIRDGLKTSLGGAELIGEFYSVFSENMRELGSPVHSFKWIRSIVLSYGENVRVGVVKTAEGQLAAAGIVLLHRHTVSIPWASSLKKYNRQNPNVLLYWRFLEFSADSGFLQFDFGRSTPGEGTYKFKVQWGAKPIELEWETLPSMKIQHHSNTTSKRKIVTEIWKRLPLFLCNVMGPTVRRYINL